VGSKLGTCPATRTQASQKGKKLYKSLWLSGQSVAAQPPTSHLKEQKKMERKRENKVAYIAVANFPGWLEESATNRWGTRASNFWGA